MRTGSLRCAPGALNIAPVGRRGPGMLQDEEYACFRKLMYEISKLGPEGRVVAKGVVRYIFLA